MEVEADDDDLPELSTLLLPGSSKDDDQKRTNAAVSKKTATDRKWRSGSVPVVPVKLRGDRTGKPKSPARTDSECEASQIGQGIPQATDGLPIIPRSSLFGAMPCLQPTQMTHLPPPPRSALAALENTTTTTRSSRQIQQRKSPGKGHVPLSPVKRGTTSPAKQTVGQLSDPGVSGSKPAFAKAKSTDNASSLKLAHVNSLLLPLSRLAIKSKDSDNGPDDGKKRRLFGLEEAACTDDTEGGAGGSEDDNDGTFTDLSGFIVDDNADISFQDSCSLSESDSESKTITGKSPVRKKLVRGAKKRTDEPSRDLTDELRSLSMEDDSCMKSKKPKPPTDGLAGAIASMHLGGENREPKRSRSRGNKKVADLASSSERLQVASPFDQGSKIQVPRWARRAANQHELAHEGESRYPSSDSGSATTGGEAILRFSPPRRKSPLKAERNESTFSLREAKCGTLENADLGHNTCATPPKTPPTSPSKLRSPSKLNSPDKKLLLSPSKRADQIPQSPHRQSIDAFWSSEVINEWNDEYSPVKPPLTVSPKKRWRIWGNESGSDSESPCESPARRMGSPTKAVGSPSKIPGANKKEAATAAATAKKKFSDQKVRLSKDLFKELDEKVSDGTLAKLSQSTGGVKIIWSKNLRSTAGRANWRRTVTKIPTGSQLKADHVRTVAEAGNVQVQHYASIELAEKVIDNEERLVNTLAHEYCHLANFMVSGVRDQPHGASFKRW